jgi:hypothetical protein
MVRRSYGDRQGPETQRLGLLPTERLLPGVVHTLDWKGLRVLGHLRVLYREWVKRVAG